MENAPTATLKPVVTSVLGADEGLTATMLDGHHVIETPVGDGAIGYALSDRRGDG